ncbi:MULTISPECIES: hypothetical protein [Priestia]|uniref:hypothetical protein n=1 Tax=Priestia TaxID=2800373 RepID=UPI002E1AD6E7|nr:hypothetical protein [Priestia aryabhattai]
MNEPTNLIENGVTRTSLKKARFMNKFKMITNKLVWIVMSISIMSEAILVFKLYKLYSASVLPMSLIIMYLSLSILIFFLSIIMAIRHSKVKPDNPYYQYLFMVISTIIGFTFSASFQEFLKEHEEKENLIATLNPSIDYYKDLYKDLKPVVIERYENQYSSPSEEFKNELLYMSEKVKTSRETMINVAYNDPQNFKGLSPELKVFLSSSTPLTVYYDNLANDPPWTTFSYRNYELLRLEVRNRTQMLQAEVRRLKGSLSKKQFQIEIRRIAEMKELERADIETKSLDVYRKFDKTFK